jgi:uncharacterized protein (DUF58 family)
MTEELVHVEDVETNRWLGVAGAVLAAVAVGIITRTGTLLVLAGFGTALLAYARVLSPPTASVAVERRIHTRDPGVGESVTVDLTVRNVGSRTLPDVRAADGVPASVRVVDGTERVGTALRPGAARTITYEVAGGEGQFRFEPVTVAVRDVAGLVERRVRLRPTPDVITWTRVLPAELLPAFPETGYPGREETDEGGEGLTFHGIREYQPGDSVSRIDWSRRARTGDLATVEYRRPEAASVVIVVDTRREAALAPDETADTAIERSVSAASALFEGFHEAGHQVGIAALPTTEAWLPPGHGRSHLERGRQLLAEGDPFGATGTGYTTESGDRLFARIPVDAQVLVLTPLCDETSYLLARQATERGHPTTVVSPDPTVTDTPGHRIVTLERAERQSRLRAAGARVHDWPPAQSFERVAARARRLA